METARSAARYSVVAMVLHWLIAFFILLNLALGYFMEGFAPPLKDFVVTGHESAGLTVLLLTLARVLWRLTHTPPPFSSSMRKWEVSTAHIVHFLLYSAMVVMPLLGWAIISAHPPAGSPGALAAAQAQAHRVGAPTSHAPALPAALPNSQAAAALKTQPKSGGRKLWWVVPMPQIMPIQNIGVTPGGVKPQKELHEEFVAWHSAGGFVLIALLLLHLAGALKHQFVDKEAELARMGLVLPKRWIPSRPAPKG